MTPRPTSVLPVALALATLSFGAVAASPPGNASTVCAAPSREVSDALMRATNKARASARRCGSTSMAAAPKLRWNRALQRAAGAHSRDMARNDFHDHTGSDGLVPRDRALAKGFPNGYVGENIAGGQRDVGTVHDVWLKSPGHCKNIMRKEYTHMGVACARDTGSTYGNYWTVVFGRAR